MWDIQPGKASFILGGQWGSEGKGAAAAWLAKTTAEAGKQFSIVTTNAGAQAGHTSIHDGKKRVVYHLPTAPLIAPGSVIYLNAGSVIDVKVLFQELEEHKILDSGSNFFIHPNAAIITDECKAAEAKPDSAQTKIASTRKGVGEALSRKVLRSGLIARDCLELKSFVRRLELNDRLARGASVLVEVPQGISLSLNGKFYPHCTSRDCTVMQAMSDAHIHPSFVGQTMLVLRTYPIRVGNIVEEGKTLGESGSHYHDQQETTWEELGVEPEITTVTKRVRRVFSWSVRQLLDAMVLSRPQMIFLSFCDYVQAPTRVEKIVKQINDAAYVLLMPPPVIICQSGPTTNDAYLWKGTR